MTQKLTNIKEDVETLNKHVRNENWSMVEILAEKLGYYFEDHIGYETTAAEKNEQSPEMGRVDAVVSGLIDELQQDKEKVCQVCGDLDSAIWKECGCYVEGINEGLAIAISKLQKAL